MSQQYDVVVIGGGHNGLTVGAYLAKAGLNVCVLERNNFLGGATNTIECTLPGFKHDTGGIIHGMIQANPMLIHDELGLKSKYGLKYITPKILAANVFPDDTAILFHGNVDDTCQSIAKISEHDAEAYRKFIEMTKSMVPLLVQGMFNAPPPFGTLMSQLDQTPEGQNLIRHLMMSAYDVVNQWFEHPKVKMKMLKISSEPMVGPEEKGTAINLFVAIPMVQMYGCSLAVGGSVALPQSLARCIEAHGGTVRLSSEVTRIKARGGRAESVILGSGEEISARKAIVSNVDARVTILKLLEDTISDELKERIRRIQDPSFSGIMIPLALNQPLQYKAGPEVGQAGLVEPLPWLEEFRRLFDDLRYGEIPTKAMAPFVVCPTVHDPSRAPEGKHVLYLWQYEPYYLKDGGPSQWDRIKERVADQVMEYLSRYITNMGPGNVLKRAVISPTDLERMNPNLVNGSVLGPGGFLYQSFSYRPIPELGRYKTPVNGLYLSGHATHPGGSIGSGGRATVQVIMEDLGIDFDDVIAR